jgi:hypothetical protein
MEDIRRVKLKGSRIQAPDEAAPEKNISQTPVNEP